MSKRQSKAHASSSRAPGFGGTGFGSFATAAPGFGASVTPLSYLAEQPDLTTISNPNVVVNFKNLSKKDGTTKAKALEELQTYVTSSTDAPLELEEGILDAWKAAYPRASIDASRRVRQNAHTLNGLICAASGRRILQYMPSLVGPWMAGLNDNDKLVARAASDALEKVFPTPVKQLNLSKVYQSNILEFANNAALEETAQTLSDERTTTSEDAEAKYYRVVASSLAVVTTLLATLPDTELQKQESVYEQFSRSEKSRSFFSVNDPSVRRAISRLFIILLEKRKDYVSSHVSQLSETLLSKSVLRHQSGSAPDFVRLLTALSTNFPIIWSSTGTKKSHPVTRLSDLFKAGSQGAPPQYWNAIAKLFDSIPEADLPSDLGQSMKLLESLHSGIIRRDEPRSHIESAWTCYAVIINKSVVKLRPEDEQKLMEEFALPAVLQYLMPDMEKTEWTIQGARSPNIIANLVRLDSMASIAEREWPVFANILLERIQTLAPEQSKDYASSQASVAADGARHFILASLLVRSDISPSFSDIITKSTGKVISGSQEVLKARQGKPYGAAEVIEVAVRSLSSWFFSHEELAKPLMDFVAHDLPDMIASPSQYQLIDLLYDCKQHAMFSEAWNSTLDAMLAIPDTKSKVPILRKLLGSPDVPEGVNSPVDNPALQKFLFTELGASVRNGTDLDLLKDVLASPTRILAQRTTDDLLADMMKSLTINDNAPNAISSLQIVAQHDPRLLKEYIKGSSGGTFLQALLSLTESGDDELATAATTLNHTIETMAASGDEHGATIISPANIINRSLYSASSTSLSAGTLVDFAERFLDSTSNAKVQEVLPDLSRWADTLKPFLDAAIPPALTLTNSLGGVVYIIRTGLNDDGAESTQRDKNSFSIPLRIALYTTRLLWDPERLDGVEDQLRARIYELLSLTAGLAIDNAEIYGTNYLWKSQDSLIEKEMLEFISSAQHLLRAWSLRPSGSASSPEPKHIQIANQSLFESSSGLSSSSFHNARAYARSVAGFIEETGWQQFAGQDLEAKLKGLRRSKDDLSFASFLVAFQMPISNTPALTRICNELVADLTGTNLSSSQLDVVKQLAYLNLIIQAHYHIVNTIAKQRLIFFIQHVVSWLIAEDTSDEIRSEVCKALSSLLPHIQDIYGTFWSSILGYLSSTWNNPERISRHGTASAAVPAINASLRLGLTLQKLAQEDDSNDDLKEAWQEKKDEEASALLILLRRLGQFPEEFNLPLQTTTELLGRAIGKMPVERVKDLEELYPLMATSQNIQRIAFDILRQQIPLKQETISLDVALDKSTARLPEELLSLIIDAPTVDSFVDTDFERTMPTELQRYLSSWLLVFDHFRGASDKVITDYIAHIKEGEYHKGLLDFTFDFLGHSSGKPVKAAGFEIRDYTFGMTPFPIKDVQWFLIHLYYLCLKHIPMLTKSWWTNSESKQVYINVEVWTQQYLSPLIIADALKSVATWASAQDESSDDALTIKPNFRAQEVTVSRELDSQNLSLVIRLPATFPLAQATVHELNRVAVDEKKWKSWLLIMQGVITFSNNSLIEGIIVYKRNVSGALKGQTECPICYSLVGSDKTLPTKRCTTCKNMFHGGCLYKWFKSSNSSSCPLCRNLFSYH